MKMLTTYLNTLPTAEQHAFAERCGTTVGYLRKQVSAGQKFSADLCIELERESQGAVRCEDLRDDVDWDYIRSSSSAPKPKARRRAAQEA